MNSISNLHTKRVKNKIGFFSAWFLKQSFIASAKKFSCNFYTAHQPHWLQALRRFHRNNSNNLVFFFSFKCFTADLVWRCRDSGDPISKSYFTCGTVFNWMIFPIQESTVCINVVQKHEAQTQQRQSIWKKKK